MANPSQKSGKVRSVTQVSSLAGFVKWVNDISGENILFRGLANAEWGVESSLYRRLKFNKAEDIDSDMFLERTKILIIHASEEGYDIKNNQKLNDLELLANLQHHGAATCLIDFTKHSLIALCFACESADNKIGKVVAFDRDNTKLYNEIKKDIDKDIEYWLTEYEINKKPWVLSPRKLNNRITSQQSVFVFGGPTLSAEKFYTCEIKNKKRILEELKKNGISAGMLFDDFVGFSTQNSHNKKYDNWVPDSDFASGKIYQASKDFETAIQYYDKAIHSNPKNSAAYNNRGTAKKNLGKFQDAILDYDKAIKLNPKHYRAYRNRGIAKKNLGKLQDAILDYNKAIKLNPKYSLAYHNRGFAKYKLGKLQDAINDYDKAIRLNPEYSVAYRNRGIAKKNLGKLQDAISDYNEAIRLNPTYSLAYNNRGNTKCKLGNFKNAISDYDEAIRLNPKSFEAYYNRGLTRSELGDIKGAAADFARAKEINPELDIPDLPPDNFDK